jgi:hypothetical protein
MLDEFGYLFCVSCGRTLVGPSGQQMCFWGHSHNLSVKQYPEFENDKDNFKPRCNECHIMLDDIRDFEVISKFKDFAQLMEYRKIHSVRAYNTWVGCLIAIGNNDYQYETDN